MIEAIALSKRFGERPVLRDVSFAAHNGLITVLLGANGAGKTTILRAVTGLMRPTEGRVTIDGLDVVSAGRAARSRVGVVADHFGLFPYLTAREHLRLAAELRGLHGDALDAAVAAAEDALGVSPFASTQGRHLSQGQAMRVAVARAVVGAPANVVMDEPTRGLDIFGIRLLRQLLFALREQGCAVLLTNHTLAETEGVADEMLVLAQGHIVAHGTPAEVRRMGGSQSMEESIVRLTQGEGRT